MDRPNILFICSDQEQAFPQFMPGFRLPARERLRRNGVTFLNFQASSTLCTSSRSVIYCGQHPPQTGMWDNLNFSWIKGLDRSIPTLGHMLREVGYYTAYKGRWLLSRLPETGTADDLESFGFADYLEGGDLWGMPQEGYQRDREVAAEASRWLTEKAPIF